MSDDCHSVSSTLESDMASIASFSTGGGSGLDTSSIASAFKTFNDPFRGVEDEEFSNLDRYGFKLGKNERPDSEQAFMQREREKLEADFFDRNSHDRAALATPEIAGTPDEKEISSSRSG